MTMVRYHLDADRIATLTFDLEGKKQNVLDEAVIDALADEFAGENHLIDRLQQAGAELAVDFDGGGEDQGA